jgi:hypothetical protein
MGSVAIAVAGALAITAAWCAPAEARRPGRCVVQSSGETYRGPCTLYFDDDGSFNLVAVGRRFVIGEITDVSVRLESPGAAEVRGLTKDGINSRWGPAVRSPTERACWLGSDFKICAYRR